jgi:glycosyltransferase involved in cell wall biosynthesis
MKLSLIAGTLGRAEVLQRLLQSLDAQTHQDFELIVVDQNDDDRVERVLEPFEDALDIRHLRMDRKGLSRARNEGLQHVTGDVVAFPDDDCWYPEDLLETIDDLLQRRSAVDGVTARSYTLEGQRTVQHGASSGRLTLWNVFGHGRGISYCIFLRANVVESVGRFDENVGVGAGTQWGSGEETDYLIRSLQQGYRIEHRTDLRVHHPKKDGVNRQRIESYGRGIGYVFRKNKISFAVAVWALLRVPTVAMIYYATTGNYGKAQLNWLRLKSRIFGYLGIER